jgi:hypothetical protein
VKTKLMISACVLLSVFVMGADGAGCNGHNPTKPAPIAPPPKITNTPKLTFYVDEDEFTCRAVPVWKIDEGSNYKLLVLNTRGEETVLYVTISVFTSAQVGHVYEFTGPVGDDPVIYELEELPYTTEWNDLIMAYTSSKTP